MTRGMHILSFNIMKENEQDLLRDKELSFNCY